MPDNDDFDNTDVISDEITAGLELDQTSSQIDMMAIALSEDRKLIELTITAGVQTFTLTMPKDDAATVHELLGQALTEAIDDSGMTKISN